MKQLVSQKQLLDKNQGKHESIELKKRESIMVVGLLAGVVVVAVGGVELCPWLEF